MRWFFLLLGATLLLTAGAAPGFQPGQAIAQERSERISFARGRSSSTVHGTIVGMGKAGRS